MRLTPHFGRGCGIKRGTDMAGILQKEDLRVIKTKGAIQNTFRKMLCEMDYKDITIKELTARALINRKTFYLHYNSLDDLLKELQDEIIQEFVKENISYHSRGDIRKSIRFFFEYAADMPELHEKLICSGSYAAVSEKIHQEIMEHRKAANKGAFSSNEYIDNLAFAFFATTSITLYRQWVKDGKTMPLEELINTATNLICKGLDHYVK